MHEQTEDSKTVINHHKNLESRNTIIITIERRSTGNIAPSYSLTINGDGTIIYHGIENVKTIGKQKGRISEKDVNQLVNEFINIYYFALKDRYDTMADPSASSTHIVTTSILLNGKTKKVFHVQESIAPYGLSVLEDKIDKITNSKQWTGID